MKRVPQLRSKLSPIVRYGVGTAIILLAIGLLWPQLHTLHHSLMVITRVQAPWLLAALACLTVSYLLAVLKLGVLLLRPVPYGQLASMQVASAAANRLIPGGLGTISVIYDFLRKQRFSRAESAVITMLNDTLGIVAHVLLAVAVLITGYTAIPLPLHRPLIAAIVGGCIAVLSILLSLRPVRRKFLKWCQTAAAAFKSYRQRPVRLLLALLYSTALTLSYAGCLWACLRALGLELSPAAVFVVLTFGVGATTATPLPGGLVGTEGALAGGLIWYGLTPAAALAVTLLYRLVSFWLPLSIGTPILLLLRRRGLL